MPVPTLILKLLSSIILLASLSACATKFDKTSITSDVRVPGPGYTFVVPNDKPWSAVDFGTSNRIRISQLNYEDSYLIRVALNRGPFKGAYTNAEAHLVDYQKYLSEKDNKEGFIEKNHQEWVAEEYGDICIEYTQEAEDWAGRNSAGPAIVEKHGLICPHPSSTNILVSIELQRRSEISSKPVDLNAMSKRLFQSFEYQDLY